VVAAVSAVVNREELHCRLCAKEASKAQTLPLVWTIGKKYLTMVMAAQTDGDRISLGRRLDRPASDEGTDRWHMAVGKALTRSASQPP
jgi:hypothetical protein